jgi:ATP-dependent helicase/nuclease subunit A
MENLITAHFTYSERQIFCLRAVADLLLKSDKSTDTNTGVRLADWLSRPDARGELVDGYVSAFLTKDGELRKKLFTNNALHDEELIDNLLIEQQRVYEFEELRKTASILAHTADVLTVAEGLLAEYEAIKRAHAWMDYDDLILSACELLTRAGMSPWVLFKLDGGIDHILVDEAQDTSPQQWQIVDALAQEFFAGDGRSEASRSLFVVGDEKQSIYSFQGANVKELAKMQGYFSEKIADAKKPVHKISLTKSYRSADAVLKAVDAVFSNPKARAGVTFDDAEIKHILVREGVAGRVELWPLIRAEEGDTSNSPTTLLVRKIADEIADWIANGQASAGEIMILLRSRGTLADRLVRALKRRGVPVAGSDRMRLNDNLAVQDLVALAQVLLLPEDDLTLAACLKSPIFNVDEDALFRLAYNRADKNLWQRLGELPEFAETYEMLVELRAKADYMPVFELYSHLLDSMGARANFIGRMGEECADPIDEFSQQALLYERSHPPSLQGFLHWLSNSNSEIKRDMEQARDAVRIMTVHGAKGLQAKIVILPDTTEPPREQETMQWLGDIPIRAPDASKQNKLYKQLYAKKREESLAEYRRLLYVALTRAEDRLYICGATAKEKISEECWYSLVEEGLEQIQLVDDGLQMMDDKNMSVSSSVIRHVSSDFAFLQNPPPAEPSPSKPLTPSRPSAEIPANASPLAGKQVYAAGKYVHLLLQHLPLHEAQKRSELAEIIARKFTGQIDDETLKKATRDALNVIENPEFSFLFSEKSLSEVPITGTVDFAGEKVTVSGQIDRLYIGENEVWIVDFKSNQLPPTNLQKIPTAYTRQLALYRALMQQIEPQKTIKCALLWTATAKLDVLSEATLDEWFCEH